MMINTHLPLVTLLQLSWRNLWRHTKRTVITLLSIAAGFALAVFSIGLQDGGHNSMVRNAINMGEGHITIQPAGYLESPANYKFIKNGADLLEDINKLQLNANFAPRISLRVLASTASNAVGVALEGLNPVNDQRKKTLASKVIKGNWLKEGDSRGLLIGTGMARKLKAKVGSKIVIMSGKEDGNTEAQLGRVRGIFKSGVTELDSYLVISDLSYARKFLASGNSNEIKGPLTRIAVFIEDTDDLQLIKSSLSMAITSSSIAVLDWQEMLPQLVQYIVIDDAFSYVMLLLILIVILFGIVNTVLMSVLERTREFGLLRALGLSRNYLLTLVFFESLLLSMMALFFGWLLGGSVHTYFATTGLDFTEFLEEGTQIAGTVMDPVIIPELSVERILQLSGIVFFVTLASGIYPAIKAARVTPVQALRT
jgi:putative ABC transport system permease protein